MDVRCVMGEVDERGICNVQDMWRARGAGVEGPTCAYPVVARSPSTNSSSASHVSRAS